MTTDPTSTTSTTSSPHTSTDSLSNSASTSPSASQHADLPDTDGNPASGLRLRLNAPTFNSDDDAPSVDSTRSPPDTPEEISRAPSLLPLTVEATELAVLGKPSKKSSSKPDKKKDASKSRKRHKSPLLDALKLPPLSEISIPRPVQIKFAPLHIPPHRRLQTAAVAVWSLMIPICFILSFFLLSLPFLWPITIPYLIWVNFIDKAHQRGGRPKKWARYFKGWKYFAQYYPCSLVKEADLPPEGRYVFGYHPHGIIGMGAVATFATEATGFTENFPGVKPHLLTLDSNFKIPIYRDILLAHGICSVSRKSCINILGKGPGNAITIVVGGAAESLYAHPGTNDLTLKKRLGFIKVAIREGAQLVPVFSFGENDIFDQLSNEKGTLTYSFQKRFQAVFGFTLPLFHGRGIFNYNYGLMPFRHPIVTVVGRPIAVEQQANPETEYVQDIQKQYIDELVRIWEKYKDLYAQNRTRELTLIE